MNQQVKNTSLIFVGSLIIKVSNFLKQILLAYFLGVSVNVDVLLVAQIIPAVIQSMIGGSAGEVLITKLKNNSTDKTLVIYYLLILLVINITLAFILIASSDYLNTLFGFKISNRELFNSLFIIFCVNLIPQVVVSGLRPYLFYESQYKTFIYSTLVAEIVGLLLIVFMVKENGILIFAFATLLSSFINAFLYLWSLKIHLQDFKYRSSLTSFYIRVKQLFTAVFGLGGQTLIYQIVNLVERTIAVNFLSTGYLSSLNYAKSLNELPNAIFTSSVLTSTFIEQSKKSKGDRQEFVRYTQKFFKFYLRVSIVLQLLSIILAPFVIIVIFRRGAFDSSAVSSTLLIYQILQLGLICIILNEFLTRTMYIYERYKNLFLIVLVKTFMHLIIILIFVNSIPNILPIAIVLANLATTAMLIYQLKDFFDLRFIMRQVMFVIVLLAFSTLVIWLNQYFLNDILKLGMQQLILTYMIIGLPIFSVVVYFSRNSPFITKLYRR